MLVCDGRYYLIGEGHKEFVGEKSQDDDFYLLTLAAVAMELHDEGLTEADVFLAAGLPLTWTANQKEAFAAYLFRNEEVDFVWKKVAYHIRIKGVRIYPQGFAAIAEKAAAMEGVNMVADIGNGTMNVLYICDGKPLSGRMFTEKFGTHQCTLAVREAFLRQTQREIDDYTINRVLRTGKANIASADLKIIRSVAAAYVQDIFRRLREHGYDESTITISSSQHSLCNTEQSSVLGNSHCRCEFQRMTLQRCIQLACKTRKLAGKSPPSSALRR